MAVLWILVALFAAANCEVLMTVTPEFVNPDVTPSFSLNCGLLDSEGVKIVSMAITRRTAAQENLQAGQAEPLASLSALTPNVPVLSTQYPGVTALGQITSFESELGSYIQMVWPNPSVEDLGMYNCEAVVIGEMGMLMTLEAFAWVTTSDPMMDRLLLVVSRLEGKLDTFNATLIDLQEQVDNITAAQKEMAQDTNDQNGQGNGNGNNGNGNGNNGNGDGSEETTTPVPTTTTSAVPEEDPRDAFLNRLANALESLDSKLDKFNHSMATMERKIDLLEDDNGNGNETETDEDERPNHVFNWFTFNTSIFALISGPRPFNAYSAQALCESNRLYLAEIQNKDELQAINEEMSPYLWTDELIFIGGRLASGSDVWRYQESEAEVTYFGGSSPPTSKDHRGTCLALQKSRHGLSMVGVVCSESKPRSYVLCEDFYVKPTAEAENAENAEAPAPVAQ